MGDQRNAFGLARDHTVTWGLPQNPPARVSPTLLCQALIEHSTITNTHPKPSTNIFTTTESQITSFVLLPCCSLSTTACGSSLSVVCSVQLDTNPYSSGVQHTPTASFANQSVSHQQTQSA